jgi:hypothetical protein
MEKAIYLYAIYDVSVLLWISSIILMQRYSSQNDKKYRLCSIQGHNYQTTKINSLATIKRKSRTYDGNILQI